MILTSFAQNEKIKTAKHRGKGTNWNFILSRILSKTNCNEIEDHFHQDNTPVHNSILVTDYLTKMGIKTVPHPPYSLDLAPCDFCLFPKLKEKLRVCRYETIEEMKEAITKVIDMITQEDFHGALQKLFERRR